MNRLHINLGMTLIELMVAQTLALIVIGGTLGLIGPSIALSEQQRANALLQESGRLALGPLTEAVEQAGYRGCAHPDQGRSAIDPAAPALSPTLTAWAYQPFNLRVIAAGDTDTIDALLGSGWNARRYGQDDFRYGDLLMVQVSGATEGALRTHDHIQQTLTLDGDQRQAFGRGQLIGISDCSRHIMLQISDTALPTYDPEQNTTRVSYRRQDTANCPLPAPDVQDSGPSFVNGCNASTEPDRYQFADGSRVWSIHSHLYYLGRQPGTDYPSLYRTGTALNGARVQTEIVVEGVENLRLIPGIDSNGDGVPDEYRQRAIGAGERIVSVRIWAQMSTLVHRGHGNASDTVTFADANGEAVPCNANAIAPTLHCPVALSRGAMRRVVHREVMLRNPA